MEAHGRCTVCWIEALRKMSTAQRRQGLRQAAAVRDANTATVCERVRAWVNGDRMGPMSTLRREESQCAA